MISITREIIGPGIEEDYQDALIRIDQLLDLLKGFPSTNDTNEGRVKLELLWLKQEITAGRLPLPVDEAWIATINYSHANEEMGQLPSFHRICDELIIALEEGLVKPRHYPVVASMIDDVLLRIHSTSAQWLVPTVNELIRLKRLLNENRVALPLSEEEWPAIADMDTLEGLDDKTNQILMSLSCTLIDGWRPDACSKGPLPAPNSEPLRREARPV
jgi:hypothetical protein